MSNKIALGTVQFGTRYGISNKVGFTTDLELRKILDRAEQEGMEILDTAYAYGTSQDRLGPMGVGHFKIVSKFLPPKPELTLENQLVDSLSKLKVSNLYAFIAHRPVAVVENPKIWEKLNNYKKSGLIDKVGFSFNTLNEVLQVKNAGFIPDLIQVPFNILNSRFTEFMKEVKNQGCEVHTRSAFLQGLFFCEPESLNSHFDPVKDFISDLNKLCSDRPSFLLHYCVRQDFIDKVVIGVNNEEQLVQNLDFGNRSNIQNNEIAIPSVGEEILSPSNWPK